MEEQQARRLASEWIAAFNSHDLDTILDHYEDDIVLTSPAAARLLKDPAGTVRGKAALRSYFAKGSSRIPGPSL